MKAQTAAAAFLVLFAWGCGDTVGERVTMRVSARGAETPAFGVGDFHVTLDEAQVGFGPLYLCASNVPSDELCGTALAELTTSVTVDALDPDAQPLPPLEGTTGEVRSAVFDYGISWALTSDFPTPGPGAPGGHSMKLRGTAARDDDTFEFFANVDVTVKAPGRLATGVATTHALTDDRSHLTLGFDPRAWLENVDFERLAELAAETPDEPVELASGSPSYDAIVISMTARRRVVFDWSRD